MRFSIVTISFNQIAFLEKCIKSVAAQKGDWEHIIVDPGSTDGSRELINAYAGHFSEIILDRDEGPADGLNRGFAKATGDIGYFLNSDDFLLPGAVEFMEDMWTRYHSQMDVMLCGAWKINAAGSPTAILLPTLPSAKSFQQGRSVIVQQGMSFRMSLFNDIGGFNKRNTTCWDGELVASFVANDARCRTSHRRLAAFRIHDESISGGAGGEALAKRYDEDTRRIITEKFKKNLIHRGRCDTFILNKIHYLHNPCRTLKVGLCRIFPWIMSVIWSKENWSR
jgi:glycosyltransferase involved in cell wall biosynthesis